MILFIVGMALQASGLTPSRPSTFDPPVRCNGSQFVQTCFLADGGRYTERLLERGRLVRDGVDANGTRWTETEVQEFDGTRTTGSDNHNHTWTYSYSPRLGTRGTNRNGPVFIPPDHRKDDEDQPAPGSAG
jgi:hypothetical protein